MKLKLRRELQGVSPFSGPAPANPKRGAEVLSFSAKLQQSDLHSQAKAIALLQQLGDRPCISLPPQLKPADAKPEPNLAL